MFKLVHSGSKTFCCWQLQVIQAAECVIIHAELNLQLDKSNVLAYNVCNSQTTQ